ncbi:protein of unknown function [Micropruina glycogenica]|uniref:Uncharacterized protein n=1 Tax=Micropruina glycogenica TaxID=75385 RepID=A0A2N9JD36_9ACTN|nr:protein of unknown function [Micropruina glycogenica]
MCRQPEGQRSPAKLSHLPRPPLEWLSCHFVPRLAEPTRQNDQRRGAACPTSTRTSSSSGRAPPARPPPAGWPIRA